MRESGNKDTGLDDASAAYKWEVRRASWTFAGLYVATALALLLLWVGASAMEARTFNRVTGKSVSTWDAMWIQLRIQEPIAD